MPFCVPAILISFEALDVFYINFCSNVWGQYDSGCIKLIKSDSKDVHKVTKDTSNTCK